MTQARKLGGVILIAVGVLLLLATGSYFAYGVYAKSTLDRLSYSSDRPSVGELEPGRPIADGRVSPARERPLASQASGLEVDPVSGASALVSVGGQPPPTGAVESSGPAISSQAPGEPARGAPSAPITVAGGTSRVEAATGTLNVAGAQSPPSARALPATTPELHGPITLAAPGGDAGLAPIDTEAALARSPEKEQVAVSSEISSPREADSAETAASTAHGAAGAFQFAFGPGASQQDPAVVLTASRIKASRIEAAGYSLPSLVDLSQDQASAVRIRIPAIGVDSNIKALSVVRTAESYAWETPKNVVGHIPTTGVPGVKGEGWYFGHLESPIRGEGNVFFRLLEVPELAKDDTIYVFLESATRKYVYQVYLTQVVHQSELQITNSGKQDITLVTCTPRFYYDHRLMVTAALVGVQDKL